MKALKSHNIEKQLRTVKARATTKSTSWILGPIMGRGRVPLSGLSCVRCDCRLWGQAWRHVSDDHSVLDLVRGHREIAGRVVRECASGVTRVGMTGGHFRQF